MEIDKNIKHKIIYTIQAVLPEVNKIYLFGSRARGDHRPDSDIDLAIESDKKIDRNAIAEIKDMLDASNIIVKIDILDLKSIESEQLVEEILKKGILWKS